MAALCLAALPLAGCSPTVEGRVGVARTADGRLVAVIFACDAEDATITVSTPVRERATPGRVEQQNLYELTAEIRRGTTVVPLTEPAAEPWAAVSGRPLAPADPRELKVHAWADRGNVNLGIAWFTMASLPVVEDAGAPDQLADNVANRATPTGTPSATPVWPETARIRATTVEQFVRDAGETCD